MTLPFDGLYTGPSRADRLASHRPPTSILTRSRVWSSGWVVVIEVSPEKGFERHLNIADRRRK